MDATATTAIENGWAPVNPNGSRENYQAWICSQLDDICSRAKASDEIKRKQKAERQSPFDLILEATESGQSPALVVGVNGSIGVGKTTLCEQLSESIRMLTSDSANRDEAEATKIQPHGPHVVLEESVDELMLKTFYENPEAMAATFQFEQANRCLRGCREAIFAANRDPMCVCNRKQSCRSVVVDRTMLIGNFAFAVLHASIGNIDAIQFEIYKRILIDAGYAALVLPHEIYLDAKPTVLSQRVAARAAKDPTRNSEIHGVDLDYLASLELTMKIILEYVDDKWPGRLTVLDWNTFGDAESLSKHILQQHQKRNQQTNTAET